jgi:hypothetical protein
VDVHEMVCHEHRSLIHFYAYMKNMNCVEFSRLMIILTLNLNSQRSANTSHERQVVVSSKGLVKSTTTTSSSSSASLSHLLAKLHLPSSRPLLQPPSYLSYLTTSPASTTSLPPPSAMEDCINTARIVSASSSPGIPKHDLGHYLCVSSLLSLAKLHLPSSRPPSATLLPELLDDVPSLDNVTASTLSYGGLY